VGRGWTLGSRLVFYTGLPVEPDIAKQWGRDRLDPFFRIDARIEKRWNLKKKRWISLVLEMLNMTLNEEAISVSCSTEECTQSTVGPVTVPSIGVQGGF
jgi:hypothetical protein